MNFKVHLDKYKRSLVTDCFHIQKLTVEALQDMRISYRRQAIDDENKELEPAKETGNSYKPVILENGDSHKTTPTCKQFINYQSFQITIQRSQG